jgi:hypothetical protein
MNWNVHGNALSAVLFIAKRKLKECLSSVSKCLNISQKAIAWTVDACGKKLKCKRYKINGKQQCLRVAEVSW